MTISLRYKKLKSGKYSVYLDYSTRNKAGKSVRKYEFLKIHVSKDYSATKRISKEDAALMELAQGIRSKRELECFGETQHTSSCDNRVNISLSDYINADVAKTKKSRNLYLLKHINGFTKGRDVLLSEVTTAFIHNFSGYLLSKVSNNTMLYYFGIFKHLLNKAVKEELIAVNPFKKCKTPPSHETVRTYLEYHEIKKLADTPTDFNPQVRTAFMFSCFTGLRYSDIINLKKNQIHKEKDSAGNETYSICIRPIKTSKTSGQLLKSPLSQEAVKIINNSNTDKNSDLVFSDLPSKAVLNDYLKKWAKLAGIQKKIYFHVARHTFATLCLSSGVDIYTVSKLLGHSNLNTTQVYARIIDEKKQKEIQKFPDFFKKDDNNKN